MSPMSSLLGYKHLKSWIPLPFAFAGNNNSPSTNETKPDASSAIETPENVSISSSPTSPVRNVTIPRPPPRHSSVLTSRQPRNSTVQKPTTNTAFKENTLPLSISYPSNSQYTTSPPPFSPPILASTPPASPIINPTPHPQRPPPTALPTSTQPRGRTLTRSTSARRALFPSRSSISLRQRTPFRSTSNTPLHHPPSPPATPPSPLPPSPKLPRYLGHHPSIDRTQLRSARLPPLREQESLHQHTTPPLLSRPSAEAKRLQSNGLVYRSPSRSSSFSSDCKAVQDMAGLYCGGEEKPGFVKVRSERQLREGLFRRGGDGGLCAREQRGSDDSGRTTRGGSEVPDPGFGFGYGGDGSGDQGRGEGVGLLGGKRGGKEGRWMGREKGFRGRVGRLGRRLSVGERRRRKRKVEGGWEWDGEERGKEELCE